MALTLFLVIVITRSITTPLSKMVRVLRGLSEGDPTQRVADLGPGEVGQLSTAGNMASTDIGSAFGEIADGAGTLSAASEDLSVVGTNVGAAAEERLVRRPQSLRRQKRFRRTCMRYRPVLRNFSQCPRDRQGHDGRLGRDRVDWRHLTAASGRPIPR